MFSSMKKLIRLDISQTNLKTLPASIGSMEEIQSLEAYDNGGLEELPDSFSSLKKLKKLYLANTAITQFHPSFGSLQDLTNLDFSGMKLKQLPNSLCSLENLVTLGLQGNDLRDIPPCFANLTKLRSHGRLNVADLLGDCSNIRLKHNATHRGYQWLRDLLNATVWRKACSCSSTASTSCGCGRRTPSCEDWMKGEHQHCETICSSKEEEQICLENSGLL